MGPERIWWWSTRAHRRGWTPLAKVLKLVNFLAFRAVLPYECEIERDVTLMHRGLGTVVHPLTRVGRGVRIGHGVTITGGSHEPGSPHRVILGDGVEVGAHACVSPRWGRALTVGEGARIGINAVVIDDVAPGMRMIAPLADARAPRPS